MMNNAENRSKKMVKDGDTWWTINHQVDKLQVFEISSNFASLFRKTGSCRRKEKCGLKGDHN